MALILQTDYKIKFVRAKFPTWERQRDKPQPALNKEQQFSQRYTVSALNRRNITIILPGRDIDLKYSFLSLDA
ncbi:MAG: hypothetical protein KI793_31770 [Rivularia sp. (in: Bacteria)]|nr:hypothetical protein [Rivularia sp. MS3]